MTKEQLAALMTTAASLYQGFQLTKERAEAWYAVIGEMEHGAAAMAFKTHFKTSQYPPTPAEIMNLVAMQESAFKVPAEKAWFFVLEAAARFGVNHGDKARAYLIGIDPEIYETAKVIGWPRICHADTQTELAFVRRDFIQAHEKSVSNKEFRRKLGISDPAPRQALTESVKALLPDVKEVA